MATMARVLLSSCLYFLVFSIQPIQTAKIVGYPIFARSQYMGMKRIAEELVIRGHEVTLLVSSVQKIEPTRGIIHAVYNSPLSQEQLAEMVLANIQKGNMIEEILLNSNDSLLNGDVIFCEALLNDTKLLDSLKKFDLIITDYSLFCGPLVADYLDIMNIEYCPCSPRMLSPFTPYESVFTLSYLPQSLYLAVNPGRMNFFQRVKNTLVYTAGVYLFHFVWIQPFEQLKKKYNIKPQRSFQEAMMDKEMTLIGADFALEYSYPIPPDYKLIGPLNVQPVKPLPPDLQQMIDSSGDDGVIIVSFGTNVALFEKEKVDIIAEALGRLKQKVIWKLQGYIPSSLSPNIKAVDWLPQNDLLAHKYLRVFVSHVGQNSLYEAAYRGIPVVALPLWSDQFDNAALLVERGLGLKLDYQSLTADDLYNTIQRVMDEPRFKENAQRISRLLSDRPRSPAQEAADWIEYTLRHGGLAHLRPYSSQLAWYQYFLVDVVLFLILIVFVVILLIKYTFRFVCWMCCRRNEKVKTQ